ncbi:MAG: hypothetical protein AB7W16_02555 [Candidatus Obscuribacterales bacterium]
MFKHRILAILAGPVAGFFATFVVHCGLIAVTFAQTMLGPGTYSGPMILMGAPLEFGLWCVPAGLLGGFLAITCNAVLSFMKVEKNQFKLVAILAGLLPVWSFFDSVVSTLQSENPLPVEVKIFSLYVMFMMHLSTLTGVVASTATLWILNQRAILEESSECEAVA